MLIVPLSTIVLLRSPHRPRTSHGKAFCASIRRCWIRGGIRSAMVTFISGTCMNARGRSASERPLTFRKTETSCLVKFGFHWTRTHQGDNTNDTYQDSAASLFCRAGDRNTAFRQHRAGRAPADLPRVSSRKGEVAAVD